MKKLLILMLTLAAAALMTGCVQMDNKTEITKDGSGTMDMTITVSDVMVEVMNDEAAEDDMKDLGKLFDTDKGELEKKLKGHNVKIEKLEKGTFNGKQGMHVIVEFKDLEGLSYAMSAISGEGEGGMAIYDEGNGNYALRPYDYNFPVPEEEAEAAEEEENDEMDPEAMQKQMALMGKLMGAMGEISVSMAITVPGDVVESNAPKVEGRTSIWTIDASNMMTAGGNMEPNIVFSGKGLKIKDLK